MKVLDRKKNFGEVFGGGRIRYEQDGVLFDIDGEEIVAVEEAGSEVLEQSEQDQRLLQALQTIEQLEAQLTAKNTPQGAAGSEQPAKKKGAKAEAGSAEPAGSAELDDQLAAQADLT